MGIACCCGRGGAAHRGFVGGARSSPTLMRISYGDVAKALLGATDDKDSGKGEAKRATGKRHPSSGGGVGGRTSQQTLVQGVVPSARFSPQLITTIGQRTSAASIGTVLTPAGS